MSDPRDVERARRVAEELGFSEARDRGGSARVILRALEDVRREAREDSRTYCGECGQPGECPCIGNFKERAEAAERQVEALQKDAACQDCKEFRVHMSTKVKALYRELDDLKRELAVAHDERAEAESELRRIRSARDAARLGVLD